MNSLSSSKLSDSIKEVLKGFKLERKIATLEPYRTYYDMQYDLNNGGRDK